jgi:hypothetical protein
VTPEQILRAVKRILPGHFDCEDIASDLWLASWISSGRPASLDVPISQGVLYGRCIDAIRHAAVQESYEGERHRESVNVDGMRVLVSKLMARISPDGVDQQLVFRRFYLDQTLTLISKDLCLSERETSKRLYNLLERLRAAARIENVGPDEDE